MILDRIENAERYFSLNPLFARAVQYLRDHIDARAGRYEISGDDCFMTIVEAEKRAESQAKIEVHDRYIDVQVVICGPERFGYKARSECQTTVGQFDTQNDIGFFEDCPSTYLDAVAGDMLIFFPEDGHAPLVGQGVVRKVIIKVRV